MIGVGGVEDFAHVPRELHAAPDEGEQLQLAVDLAVKLISGCDHAGVSMVAGRSICTAASSDNVVCRGDALQYELDEGPCLDSLRWRETVVSQDLRREERWPRWTPRALTELGIEGIMSLWLYTNASSYGALNLYANRTEAFEHQNVATGQALAAQISVALAAKREIGQRSVAMTSRTVIGQAEGIVMERLGIDADQAFTYLRRISQSQNRKLVTICNEIIEKRQLPAL
ncbi:MAG TPA: GAF and ANTAR domain-containing protein [Propionibacteriaceae bacterium]|nr:GAF and ANTAR domain-containing protein [Propionibacteriaceae bacterium]